MPQIIVDSINRSDLDMRKELFQSIVLSGGTTLTKGGSSSLLQRLVFSLFSFLCPNSITSNWQALEIGCFMTLKG